MRPWQQVKAWVAAGADPDAALVKAARQGDRLAFDTLTRPYRASLRGFVQQRVGSAAAEDVLQEVLLACWTGLPGFRGQSRFKAWLFGIALNKCNDSCRAQERMARNEEATELIDTQVSVEEAYAATELKEIVLAMLAQLPTPQREVMEMYYYGELTLAEIGLLLNRNVNTVKYQFYQAHTRLARLCGEPNAITEAMGTK